MKQPLSQSVSYLVLSLSFVSKYLMRIPFLMSFYLVKMAVILTFLVV